MEIPKIPDEKIIEIMQHVIDVFLIPKFISLGMNATGAWIDALEPRVNNGNGEIWGFDYTYWLVNGRKPGKMPPIAPLITWVNAKFGINGPEAKGIAFAIAQKIKNEGTEYYPDGTDLLDVLNSPECKAYIIEQIGTFYSLKISKILKKQIHDNFA